jgi:hypothetical protein
VLLEEDLLPSQETGDLARIAWNIAEGLDHMASSLRVLKLALSYGQASMLAFAPLATTVIFDCLEEIDFKMLDCHASFFLEFLRNSSTLKHVELRWAGFYARGRGEGFEDVLRQLQDCPGLLYLRLTCLTTGEGMLYYLGWWYRRGQIRRTKRDGYL